MSTRVHCPCCRYLTLAGPPDTEDDICLVCFWQFDPSQHADPELAGGANRVSLREARHNFETIGASEPSFLGDVRPPLPEEQPRQPLPDPPP